MLALALVPRLLPGSAEETTLYSARFALPRGALALPALLTFCSMFVESASMNWSSVFLAGPAGAGVATAAGGVVAFSIAMTAARFAGDSLLVRWGVGQLSVRGGLLSCAGIVLALATRSPVSALAGCALVGAAAPRSSPRSSASPALSPGSPPASGSRPSRPPATRAGRPGPAIGFLARGVGLTGALGVVAVAAALIALLGPRLPHEQR